ncbi:PstS family phosphate ABC transporter substrate-binding protein [Daejeonella lutea]|uniref:Phosphate transport system substrate-binding protein n=1 Tax=Daejeonella lutea TaxID=572036 RepID=A0A1T5D7T8_9SPHI|nr:substrate-binding domain-containing protein [Daejeonella lutea]SKB67696.1 phosphate transport system substrate-binding protein [Daejeonella lutea]
MIKFIKSGSLFLAVLFLLLASCSQNKTEVQTYTSGNEKILVDESLAPIIEDQTYVFESSYPDAKLELIRKSENELINSFLDDSSQIAILSRDLTAAERKHFESRNIKIRVNRFAIDGIALIAHNSVNDSTVTVEDIIKVLRGEKSSLGNLIFDNANSSTVRYFKELASVKVLPAQGVYALKTNAEVIKYVFDNPGTIGVVGVNWIVQPPEDLEEEVSSLKILGVKNVAGKPGSDAFYKPFQNDIALEQYPLLRSLYIINCEGGPGLGTGFASFIAGERGQRIVLKSGLLPDSIPSREINIIK